MEFEKAAGGGGGGQVLPRVLLVISSQEEGCRKEEGMVRWLVLGGASGMNGGVQVAELEWTIWEMEECKLGSWWYFASH